MNPRLDYESQIDPPPSSRDPLRNAMQALAFILVAANVLLLLVAGSGGKIGNLLATIVGPSVNILIGVIAIVAAPAISRANRPRSVSNFVFFAVVLPVLAIFFDLTFIASMGWIGC